MAYAVTKHEFAAKYFSAKRQKLVFSFYNYALHKAERKYLFLVYLNTRLEFSCRVQHTKLLKK